MRDSYIEKPITWLCVDQQKKKEKTEKKEVVRQQQRKPRPRPAGQTEESGSKS